MDKGAMFRLSLLTVPLLSITPFIPDKGAEAGRAEIQWVKANSPESYFAQNPGCHSLTDGCIICMLGAAGAQCSTPGIACIQENYFCTSGYEAEKLRGGSEFPPHP
jgi:hypothetical protein